MNINWNELPPKAVCLVSYTDYSGLDLCYIDEKKGLCKDDGESVCFIRHHLIAINPNVSLKDFGRALHISMHNEIKELGSLLPAREQG